MIRTSWKLAAILSMLAVAACRPEFNLKNFTTNEVLYSASYSEYQRHHWDNAIAGFEKLTTDLPARDSLLPLSYWFLASSHRHQDEYLLAAQSFNRLVETFPDDSLADDAALESARAYRKLWRKPELDPTYGETAVASYNTLIGLYATSPLIPAAQKEIGDLENWFSRKDYAAGMYYFRRKAYDSGILYFKDALTKYPNAPNSKESALRLVDSYKSLKYRDDSVELCTQLRQRYPSDREVDKSCGGVPDLQPAKADSTAGLSVPRLPAKPDSVPVPASRPVPKPDSAASPSSPRKPPTTP
jgi:outer membrane assembly lipoprotein YfiO